MTMKSHGHVVPNKDGSKARCGGPKICSFCARELAQKFADDLAFERKEVMGNVADLPDALIFERKEIYS